MSELPSCPQCDSKFTWQDGIMLVCPECNHEWDPNQAPEEDNVVRDANGNVLNSGDTVIVTKDLKIKGTSSVV
ncbi:UNVERIFIED_CONTAM: hypothetical protein GTU68_023074, partial [Idotea baltica]|nr:hypothetical protein [Idotea baltica]